jgi:hypothetical protein
MLGEQKNGACQKKLSLSFSHGWFNYLQDATLGSLLIGRITYGKVSIGNGQGKGNGGTACPAKYRLSFVVPPPVKVCNLNAFPTEIQE